MNSSKIQSILDKHNVTLSEDLVEAIAEIVKAASTDRDFAESVSKQIASRQRHINRAHGIR